jgi:transposase
MNSTERLTRNDQIVTDHNDGLRNTEIAHKYGVSVATIMSVVREARDKGQVTRPIRSRSKQHAEQTAQRTARIIEMYQSKMSMAEVGEKFGISRERVRQVLKENGVESRSIGSYHTIKYNDWAVTNGDAVNAKFDELRSINRVVEAMPEFSESWIRKFLSPRKNETIHSAKFHRFWTNERIVGVLRKAASHDHRLTVKMYNDWRESGVTYDGRTPPTYTLIIWRFGSWRKGIETAGLLSTRTTKRVYRRSWSSEDVLNSVRSYVKQSLDNESRPTFAGYEAWAKASRGEHPSGSYLRWSTGKGWAGLLREATS